ncbi:MAG: hypothetical protein R3F43_09520 [bacterium]
MVYRLGVLKKFVMSVLFLDLARDPGRRAADVAAAGAAALAMFFAVIAAAWAQSSYGLNTTPFVLIIVASYVVKDRIKDWARQFFAAKMAHWLPDHVVRIREPLSGETLGRCRETMRFVKVADLPAPVRALRYRRTPDALLAGKPEIVLHYRKVVQIDAQTHRRTHGPLRDLNDIIRVNIGSFLARADDTTRRTLVYDAELDRAAPVDLPKVYHLNVVLQMGSPDGAEAPTTDRVRVVLTATASSGWRSRRNCGRPRRIWRPRAPDPYCGRWPRPPASTSTPPPEAPAEVAAFDDAQTERVLPDPASPSTRCPRWPTIRPPSPSARGPCSCRRTPRATGSRR